MTNKERLAREAVIQKLIAGYPSWAGKATQGQIDAFVDATEMYPIAAVVAAQARYHSAAGVPGHPREYPPNAGDFAAQAALQHDAAVIIERRALGLSSRPRLVSYPIGEKPPPPLEALGPTKLEIAGRMTDVSDWTLAEKEEAIKTVTVPASRNQIPAPDGKRIEVKPQRMSR